MSWGFLRFSVITLKWHPAGWLTRGRPAGFIARGRPAGGNVPECPASDSTPGFPASSKAPGNPRAARGRRGLITFGAPARCSRVWHFWAF